MSRFFRWYCHPDYYEDIEGDLEETYQQTVSEYSIRKADWAYTKEVLLLFRPTIIRPISFFNLQYTLAMLQNYFTIGYRNLKKYRGNTLLHILGLAIGLAAFLLISEYVRFEKSYDRFHAHSEQLYRVTIDYLHNGVLRDQDATTYAPAAKALEEALPEIIGSTTTLQMQDMSFRRNGQPFQEDLIAVDSSFLTLFNYPLLAGDPSNLLKEPYCVVLTKDYAEKYFGSNNPIGETIEFLAYGGTNRAFKVTGVVDNPPENTHYKFNMLVSIKTLEQRMIDEAWNGNNYYSYVLLDQQADIKEVNKKLPALSKKLIGEEVPEFFNLQPIPEIHLHSDMAFEPEMHGSSQAVHFLQLISIFILLIAWINYINLSTARALERAKEVGLRKVVGATKSQLMGQFFTEAFLVNAAGVLLAIFLVQFARPYFNELLGNTVLAATWTNLSFLKNVAVFFVLGTLVTGIYPALVLSSFRPIGVLQGKFSTSKHGVLLRKGLVVFQFAASLILIAGTIVVYQQLRYMVNQKMGMTTEQVLSFNNPDYHGTSSEQHLSKYKAFQTSIEQIQGVEKIASIDCLPGGTSNDISSHGGKFSITGVSTPMQSTIYVNLMDDKVVDVLGLDLIAGRNFNSKMGTDSTAVLINKELLKLFNIPDPESVIGKEFVNKGNYKFRIVGVLADYNRSTLKHQIEPTLFIHQPLSDCNLVKLNTKDLAATRREIAQTYTQFFPDAPFQSTFIDQRFAKLYAEDQKFGAVFANFSILAILVAIMGLFGLASFLSLQRSKEIGVRKVLGASTTQIVWMFFKDFIGLLIISFLVSVPIVYWGMSEWLNSYAFRIAFPWWSIVVGLLLLAIIAFLTVSSQTFKIARRNPALTIRTEGS